VTLASGIKLFCFYGIMAAYSLPFCFLIPPLSCMCVLQLHLVQRIENMALHDAFIARRKQIKRELGVAWDEDEHERW
jgi:hypothetical protein